MIRSDRGLTESAKVQSSQLLPRHVPHGGGASISGGVNNRIMFCVKKREILLQYNNKFKIIKFA